MNRKYLDDIKHKTIIDMTDAPDEDRRETWAKEREVYGFDSRDTWNMNVTMIELLYERLKMYQKVNNIDTDLVMIEVNGKNNSLTYWIQLIIENCEEILTDDNEYEDALYDLLPLIRDDLEDTETLNMTSNRERTKEEIWVYDRINAIDFDKINAEREVWEIWTEIYRHAWW